MCSFQHPMPQGPGLSHSHASPFSGRNSVDASRRRASWAPACPLHYNRSNRPLQAALCPGWTHNGSKKGTWRAHTADQALRFGRTSRRRGSHNVATPPLELGHVPRGPKDEAAFRTRVAFVIAARGPNPGDACSRTRQRHPASSRFTRCPGKAKTIPRRATVVSTEATAVPANGPRTPASLPTRALQTSPAACGAGR